MRFTTSYILAKPKSAADVAAVKAAVARLGYLALTRDEQTFFTFILENLEKFGALKAIGAKGRELVAMILFQATFTALTGYGLGVGLCALMIWAARLRLPDYAALITYGNLGLAFCMVLLIAADSSSIGIRKVLRIDPFDIFRG